MPSDGRLGVVIGTLRGLRLRKKSVGGRSLVRIHRKKCRTLETIVDGQRVSLRSRLRLSAFGSLIFIILLRMIICFGRLLPARLSFLPILLVRMVIGFTNVILKPLNLCCCRRSDTAICVIEKKIRVCWSVYSG